MIIRKKRGGGIEEVRPTFSWEKHNEDGSYATESATGQLTEDIRNVLEQIRDKQMLQCDVRRDIWTIALEIRRVRRVLEEAFGKKRRKRKPKKA